MTDLTTRRRVLGGMAAGTIAASIPAIVAVRASGDAALLRLWAEYQETDAEHHRHDQWWDDITARAEPLTPPLPDELREMLDLPVGTKDFAWFADSVFSVSDLSDADQERYFELLLPWNKARSEALATCGADDHERAGETLFQRRRDILVAITETEATTVDGILVKLYAAMALFETSGGQVDDDAPFEHFGLPSLVRNAERLARGGVS